MKKILITGGCGFIGSNFVRYIFDAHKDYHIVNLDKLTYAGKKENLRNIEGSSQYVFINGDIVDLAQVQQALEGVEYVVHLAAETHVDRSIIDPSEFVQTNVLGTFNLLDAAMRAGIRKFVHVSTDEVYGSMGAMEYATEKSALAPNSPYSASKAGSDMLARSYFQTYGFPVVTVRCSNNYGPYQHEEKLIPLMINNVLTDKRLPVYGDGLNVRDWLYVEDTCHALDLVLQKGRPGEVYNIGGNNEWRNIDIVKLLLKEFGKSESLIEFVKDRPGHDRRYALDTSKMREELGWAPKIKFEEGLKSTIEWYVQNKNFVQKIER